MLKTRSLLTVAQRLNCNKTDPEAPADWRIALRVEHDAEGPTASKKKTAAAAVDDDTNTTSRSSSSASSTVAPAVAVALPSGSAYYLLDDFNHHHQHAVLAGNSLRYASTHRVAKEEGHTLQYLRGRCTAVLQVSRSCTEQSTTITL
jgi:FTO catalytic domain